MPASAAVPGCPGARSQCGHGRGKPSGQGWSLLCNGVVLFDDGGALLPDGRAVIPANACAALTAA